MKIKVIAYGIARDILNGSAYELELEPPASIATVKQALLGKFPAFRDLVSLRFALNEEYCSDEQVVEASDEVVIIPPVSGG